MNRILLVITLLMLFAFPSKSAEEPLQPESTEKHFKFNFGLKGGVNASMFTPSQFTINDVTIKHSQTNFNLGFKGVLFTRFTWGKKSFLQPEISIQRNEGEVQFAKKLIDPSAGDFENIQLSSSINTVEFPLLYGYNFVNEGPYTCALFVGPKVRYTFNANSKLTFNNYPMQNYAREELYRFSYSAILGLSVTVGKIFFDVQLEKGLSNFSKAINIIPTQASGDLIQLHSMEYDRTCEALSFTLGVMF